MAEIVFHPDAAAEFRRSLRFYADKSRRAAEGFDRAVNRVLQEILLNPARHGFYDDPYREAVLPRYPFSIIYRPLPDGDVHVIAVAHASREPGYWADRIA